MNWEVAGAMGEEFAAVRPRNHCEAPVFHTGVHQRKPHRQNVGIVGLGVHNASILVPGSRSEHHVAVFVPRRDRFRNLYADVLNRI